MRASAGHSGDDGACRAAGRTDAIRSTVARARRGGARTPSAAPSSEDGEQGQRHRSRRSTRSRAPSFGPSSTPPPRRSPWRPASPSASSAQPSTRPASTRQAAPRPRARAPPQNRRNITSAAHLWRLPRARADPIPTWPALVAAELGWSTLNARCRAAAAATAPAGGRSRRGAAAARDAQVHEDAWAIVHTGGNDILRSSGRELIGFVASVAARALCAVRVLLPARAAGARRRQRRRPAGDASRPPRREEFRARRAPLAPQMPLLARMTEQLLGEGACVQRVGGFVLPAAGGDRYGSLRSVLRAFERERRADGAAPTGIVVDERSAIVEALGGEPMRRRPLRFGGSTRRRRPPRARRAFGAAAPPEFRAAREGGRPRARRDADAPEPRRRAAAVLEFSQGLGI